MSYDETYRVIRHETVTVPAGTFDAFVVEWESSISNRHADHYHEVGTFRYAPEIGYVVKIAHHLDSGLYARLGDDEALRVISQDYPGTAER